MRTYIYFSIIVMILIGGCESKEKKTITEQEVIELVKLYQEGAGKSDAEFNLNTEVDNDVYQDVVLRLQSIWLSGSDSVNFTYDTSEDELIISDANVTINENLTVGDGGVTDYMKINDTGVISLFGDAKRELTLRADLDYTTVTAQGKPTQANIGIFHGYSMPIYNNDNEELFFNENVPGRWDGASDITFHVMVALASAEDVDDTFKFQFSWNQTGETDVVSAGAYDTTDEITVVDGTQYATYMLEFTVDYDIDAGDVMITHDDIAGRLRRVASAGTEIDGEIIVLDWHTHYIVDKMFKPPE